jgi:hypothetical protein
VSHSISDLKSHLYGENKHSELPAATFGSAFGDDPSKGRRGAGRAVLLDDYLPTFPPTGLIGNATARAPDPDLLNISNNIDQIELSAELAMRDVDRETAALFEKYDIERPSQKPLARG